MTGRRMRQGDAGGRREGERGRRGDGGTPVVPAELTRTFDQAGASGCLLPLIERAGLRRQSAIANRNTLICVLISLLGV